MKMLKTCTALALAVALCFLLLPVSARAASAPASYIFDVSEGDITINDAGGNLTVTYGSVPTTTAAFPNTQMITLIGSTTEYTVTVGSGVTASITLSSVSIDVSSSLANLCAFNMAGATVNLALAGNNILKSAYTRAGLEVPAGASLTIDGPGALEATGNGGAGIGGFQDGDVGDIAIDGGMVKGIGSNCSAGIGGGYRSGGGGTVTISDGTVEATGHGGGAGIGGGSDGIGSIVTISGGTVEATGGDGGAGIGGGNESDGGTVIISGGSVHAQGDGITGGAGIGGGGGGLGGIGGSGGTVYISGGSVNAKGSSYAAGIGGGSGSGIGSDSGGSGGTVYISGGSVLANRGGGAGNHENIGRGDSGPGSGTLMNRPGGANVYCTTLTLAPNTGIPETDIGFGGAAAGYGRKGLVTGASGILYFYLPEGAAEAAYGGDLYKETVENHHNNAFEADAGRSAYAVGYILTGLTAGDSPTMVIGGEDYAGRLDPDPGLVRPASITVTMGGATLTQGTEYTYDSGTGEVIVDDVSGALLITAAGAQPDYTITAAPASLTFASALAGYAAAPGAQTVTIQNAGNQGVTLTAPASTGAAFDIGALSAIELNAGDTATFTVQPVTGLMPGTYNETITVSTNRSTSAQVNVRFMVIAPSGGSDYGFRTLTDNATGVTVSGLMHNAANLTVKPLAPHAAGDAACDEIRAAQANGNLILGFNIGLSWGFIGELTISIPVGSEYNGQLVTILHCINGRLETITVRVENGMATFTVTSLSPFAVTRGLPVPGAVVIDPPKTGDAAALWGFATLGLAVLCAGYLAMKRRRA